MDYYMNSRQGSFTWTCVWLPAVMLDKNQTASYSIQRMIVRFLWIKVCKQGYDVKQWRVFFWGILLNSKTALNYQGRGRGRRQWVWWSRWRKGRISWKRKSLILIWIGRSKKRVKTELRLPLRPYEKTQICVFYFSLHLPTGCVQFLLTRNWNWLLYPL